MISCTLTIDGQPVGTTAEDFHAGKPSALDGLSVTWGRSTRLDQPRPASCAATILLPHPEALDRFTPGKPLRVLATATDAHPKTATVLTLPHPRTLSTTPTLLPPATPSTNPAAWDEEPRVEIGATYTIRATISLPPYSTAHVRPAYYTTPTGDTYTTGPTLHTTSTTGSFTLTHTPPPDKAGSWLGLSIQVQPLGPAINTPADTLDGFTHTLDSLDRATLTALTVSRTGMSSVSATVFDGRISDAVFSYHERLRCPQVELVAVDHSVELDSVPIGDAPWPAETAAQRARRILNLAGSSAHLVIDPGISERMIQRADVDHQSARRQLQTVADSTGAVLWAASHETVGQLYRLEDPAQRKSLYRLTLDTSGTAQLEPAPWNTLTLDAHTVYLRGIELRHDTTDLATSVTVSWLHDDGADSLTSRDETVHDVDRRRAHGHHHLKVSTALATAADARALAHQLLTQTAPGSWTLPTAQLATDKELIPPTTILTLLDSTRRIGLPTALTNVAGWVPGAPTIPAYLDGGKYTYHKGRWNLEFTFTRSTLADSLTIDQATRLTIDKTPQTLDEMAAATL